MIEWKSLCEDPRVKGAAKIAASAVGAGILSLAEFGGYPVPLNTALAAAVSPACGIAALAGTAGAYALTGLLTRQLVYLCGMAFVIILRWLLNVRLSPRTAALLAAGSNLLSAVIFALAGMTGGMEWILWGIGSLFAGGLAFCLRQAILRFESGLPLRLHEGDALSFSVCYVVLAGALCSLRLLTVSFGEILAGFVVLTAAKRYRMTGGVICGTLSAFALVLANGATAGYAALLPAAGFAAGCLAGRSSVLSLLVFQISGVLSMALSGWNAQVANAFIGGVIGGLGFLLMPAVQIADAFLQWNDSGADLAALTGVRLDFLSDSIAGVRGSAERIANMMVKNLPLSGQAETVRETVCSKCISRAMCWDKGDAETRECFRRLSAADLSETLRAPFGCVQPDRVTQAFSRIKRQNAVTRTLAARLRESQKMLFTQMRITESLLHGAGAQSRRSYQRELTRYVSDVLAKFKIPVQAAAVSTGENQRMLIELYAPSDVPLDAVLIADLLSDALQRPLQSCGTDKAGDEQRLILRSAGGFDVASAAAQCAVHEDEPCGDCWETFSDGDGAYYLAVSDGMGSGRKAAVDAKIVLSDFRQLVQSGMDCRAAADMVNSIMLTKSGEERFATLDVAKISTDTASVTLYKYGAGPTFIRHGDQITLCQAATDPLGILPTVEPYTAVLELERGDMIFLLSDGVDDALFPFVRQQLREGGDLQTMAHAVCAKAQRESGGAPQDDVTVLAAAIIDAAIDA